MNRIVNFIKSHYFLIFLLAVANLLVAFFVVRYPLRLNGDAPSYLNAMKFIQGKEYDKAAYGWETGVVLRARILTTPLMLYSSIFAGKLAGGEYKGMLLINIIFYFLIIYIFYKLVYLIYQNHLVASLSGILFFTNYCMNNYGVTFRTDMAGWFFFLLATFFAVRYFKRQDGKYYYLSIFASAVGVLFKEYGALGMISLGILILFLPIDFKEKLKDIFKAAGLFLIIPLFYHLFIYFRFHFSYFDWYGFAYKGMINNPFLPGTDWNVILLVKVLGWLFLAGWPIFVWGLYQEHKNFDKARAEILLAILPASLVFLAWPALTQRIAFIFVPWLALISGFGLSKIKNRYLVISILVIYVLVNYFTRPWLLSIINL